MADNEDFEDAAQNAANAGEDEGIAQMGTTFALSPAKATSSIIRYGSKYGTSLWKEAP
jgi:predicted adenine nucleotide alpha hydrolase (AANH) superfamily ATPase